MAEDPINAPDGDDVGNDVVKAIGGLYTGKQLFYFNLEVAQNNEHECIMIQNSHFHLQCRAASDRDIERRMGGGCCRRFPPDVCFCQSTPASLQSICPKTGTAYP